MELERTNQEVEVEVELATPIGNQLSNCDHLSPQTVVLNVYTNINININININMNTSHITKSNLLKIEIAIEIKNRPNSESTYLEI
jgi:hypothetical protein